MKRTTEVAEKEMSMEAKRSCPPPQRPRPRKMVVKSATREEIERFWRMKRIKEEEHLLAAQKSAARIKARTLTEEEYKSFEDSMLKDTIGNSNPYNGNDKEKEGVCSKEVRVIIKDWWTKSKYAYLNQPSVESMDGVTKRISTYIPNSCFFSASSARPMPMLGVF